MLPSWQLENLLAVNYRFPEQDAMDTLDTLGCKQVFLLPPPCAAIFYAQPLFFFILNNLDVRLSQKFGWVVYMSCLVKDKNVITKQNTGPKTTAGLVYIGYISGARRQWHHKSKNRRPRPGHGKS